VGQNPNHDCPHHMDNYYCRRNRMKMPGVIFQIMRTREITSDATEPAEPETRPRLMRYDRSSEPDDGRTGDATTEGGNQE
jgi:hypothetical protein